jgi:hypothetical protein
MSGQLALSLWQPWASLVIAGEKLVETRRWSTKHRGPLLIHAALAIRRSAIPPEVERIACEVFGDRWLRVLPFGALIGQVEVLDVKPQTFGPHSGELVPFVGDRRIEGRERILGDYRAGRFGWLLASPRPLQEPLKVRGRQRLFTIDPDLVRAYVPKLGEPLPSWHP